MSEGVSVIAERVRERIRLSGASSSVAPDEATRFALDEVQRYSELALSGRAPALADEQATVRGVAAAVSGFGVLQQYCDDPTVEEVWVNGPDEIFVARAGVSERTGARISASELRDVVERMLHSTGRRVDLSSPFVDASLPDGSRLHVVIPDVSRFWSLNIRKFSRSVLTLPDLVQTGSITVAAAQFLRMCVLAGLNIVVSGATHTGKTTLLNALLEAAAPRDRVITVEETFELSVPLADVVGMQCRGPSLEGHGEITLRRLIKEALRMRPDRLVVGEVREAEALDLLIALNSGVPGMCSIHANSAADALVKLCTLPLLAGRNIDAAFVVPTVAATVEVVVHCELMADGARRVSEIWCPSGAHTGAVVDAAPIFLSQGRELRATGQVPQRVHKFTSAGFDPAHLGV